MKVRCPSRRCLAVLGFTSIAAICAAVVVIIGSRQNKRNDSGEQDPVPTGQFHIQLMNMGTNNKYDEAFEFAKAQWEAVITNDLPDAPAGSVDDWFGGSFDNPVDTAVDDLLIGFKIGPIEEPGVIGMAGPRYYRTDESGMLPSSAISGVMYFDQEYFEQMAPADVEIIILHEMGHVLGLGSFWPYKCGAGCEIGFHEYTCPKAKAEYKRLGFQGDLLLENDGGPGTKCGHWDEVCFVDPFSSELMTGKFEPHKRQPMTSVTLAALEDLGGYMVNYDLADEFHRTSIDLALAAESNFSLQGGQVKPLSMLPLKLSPSPLP